MKKIFTTTLLLFCLIQVSNAQFFNYTKANAVNAGNLTYTDLGTVGTAITTNFTGAPMTFDEDNSSVQNIGFTFNFSGTNFTQFVLNTNGFIRLGTDTASIAESLDILGATSATSTNVIYPFNMNLVPTVNAEYRVYTDGLVGSRTCTIQFKGIKDYDNGTGAAQYDALEFQIILYETTNIVEFVYGSFSANLNAPAFEPSNCGLKSISPAKSLNVTKASATAFTAATFIEGPYTGNAFNTRNGVLPSPGFTLRFVPIPVLSNNVSVGNMYSLGKVPINLDHTISIYVQNIGNSNLTNYPVTLTVSGANTYTNTQTLASFPSGDKQLVTFAPYHSTATGNNLVIVSVGNDDDNTDNTDTVHQVITTSTIGTAYDTVIYGTVGQSTSSIDLAVRFKCPIANKITSIKSYFGAAGKIYNAKVYTVNVDTPKTQIYTSGNKNCVAGANIVTPATPVSVSGDFFIVLTQPSTVASFGCGYQFEDPIRAKTFYFRSPAAVTSPWNDFAPLNPFRVMLEVTMLTPFPLPIRLDNFMGYKEGKNNILKWETLSEVNNTGFEIQRSLDGKEFSKIGFINTKANNGNSTSLISYNYMDKTPVGATNYYRLRQLDKDGQEFISNIVAIKNIEIERAEIVKLFPNPSVANTSIVINSMQNENYTISITDLTGKVMNQQKVNVVKGSNKINIESSNLSAGTYFIKVISQSNEELAATKFVKM